ncbi:hypothetical protein MUK42_28056 [Musa troglodytarum]|uniref:Uncharacterized protein n=1 Tax=Musa troglodytarum TaxID=320322 RepID=A0A9E7EZ82_9LILI|nr:hypothetical protein MUK42_28056 [Musa troglodytarum]
MAAEAGVEEAILEELRNQIESITEERKAEELQETSEVVQNTDQLQERGIAQEEMEPHRVNSDMQLSQAQNEEVDEQDESKITQTNQNESHDVEVSLGLLGQKFIHEMKEKIIDMEMIASGGETNAAEAIMIDEAEARMNVDKEQKRTEEHNEFNEMKQEKQTIVDNMQVDACHGTLTEHTPDNVLEDDKCQEKFENSNNEIPEKIIMSEIGVSIEEAAAEPPEKTQVPQEEGEEVVTAEETIARIITEDPSSVPYCEDEKVPEMVNAYYNTETSQEDNLKKDAKDTPTNDTPNLHKDEGGIEKPEGDIPVTVCKKQEGSTNSVAEEQNNQTKDFDNNKKDDVNREKMESENLKIAPDLVHEDKMQQSVNELEVEGTHNFTNDVNHNDMGIVYMNEEVGSSSFTQNPLEENTLGAAILEESDKNIYDETLVELALEDTHETTEANKRIEGFVSTDELAYKNDKSEKEHENTEAEVLETTILAEINSSTRELVEEKDLPNQQEESFEEKAKIWTPQEEALVGSNIAKASDSREDEDEKISDVIHVNINTEPTRDNDKDENNSISDVPDTDGLVGQHIQAVNNNQEIVLDFKCKEQIEEASHTKESTVADNNIEEACQKLESISELVHQSKTPEGTSEVMMSQNSKNDANLSVDIIDASEITENKELAKMEQPQVSKGKVHILAHTEASIIQKDQDASEDSNFDAFYAQLPRQEDSAVEEENHENLEVTFELEKNKDQCQERDVLDEMGLHSVESDMQIFNTQNGEVNDQDEADDNHMQMNQNECHDVEVSSEVIVHKFVLEDKTDEAEARMNLDEENKKYNQDNELIQGKEASEDNMQVNVCDDAPINQTLNDTLEIDKCKENIEISTIENTEKTIEYEIYASIEEDAATAEKEHSVKSKLPQEESEAVLTTEKAVARISIEDPSGIPDNEDEKVSDVIHVNIDKEPTRDNDKDENNSISDVPDTDDLLPRQEDSAVEEENHDNLEVTFELEKNKDQCQKRDVLDEMGLHSVESDMQIFNTKNEEVNDQDEADDNHMQMNQNECHDVEVSSEVIVHKVVLEDKTDDAEARMNLDEENKKYNQANELIQRKEASEDNMQASEIHDVNNDQETAIAIQEDSISYVAHEQINQTKDTDDNKKDEACKETVEYEKIELTTDMEHENQMQQSESDDNFNNMISDVFHVNDHKEPTRENDEDMNNSISDVPGTDQLVGQYIQGANNNQAIVLDSECKDSTVEESCQKLESISELVHQSITHKGTSELMSENSENHASLSPEIVDASEIIENKESRIEQPQVSQGNIDILADTEAPIIQKDQLPKEEDSTMEERNSENLQEIFELVQKTDQFQEKVALNEMELHTVKSDVQIIHTQNEEVNDQDKADDKYTQKNQNGNHDTDVSSYMEVQKVIYEETEKNRSKIMITLEDETDEAGARMNLDEEKKKYNEDNELKQEKQASEENMQLKTCDETPTNQTLDDVQEKEVCKANVEVSSIETPDKIFKYEIGTSIVEVAAAAEKEHSEKSELPQVDEAFLTFEREVTRTNTEDPSSIPDFEDEKVPEMASIYHDNETTKVMDGGNLEQNVEAAPTGDIPISQSIHDQVAKETEETLNCVAEELIHQTTTTQDNIDIDTYKGSTEAEKLFISNSVKEDCNYKSEEIDLDKLRKDDTTQVYEIHDRENDQETAKAKDDNILENNMEDDSNKYEMVVDGLIQKNELDANLDKNIGTSLMPKKFIEETVQTRNEMHEDDNDSVSENMGLIEQDLVSKSLEELYKAFSGEQNHEAIADTEITGISIEEQKEGEEINKKNELNQQEDSLMMVEGTSIKEQKEGEELNKKNELNHQEETIKEDMDSEIFLENTTEKFAQNVVENDKADILDTTISAEFKHTESSAHGKLETTTETGLVEVEPSCDEDISDAREDSLCTMEASDMNTIQINIAEVTSEAHKNVSREDNETTETALLENENRKEQEVDKCLLSNKTKNEEEEERNYLNPPEVKVSGKIYTNECIEDRTQEKKIKGSGSQDESVKDVETENVLNIFYAMDEINKENKSVVDAENNEDQEVETRLESEEDEDKAEDNIQPDMIVYEAATTSEYNEENIKEKTTVKSVSESQKLEDVEAKNPIYMVPDELEIADKDTHTDEERQGEQPNRADLEENFEKVKDRARKAVEEVGLFSSNEQIHTCDATDNLSPQEQDYPRKVMKRQQQSDMVVDGLKIEDPNVKNENIIADDNNVLDPEVSDVKDAANEHIRENNDESNDTEPKDMLEAKRSVTIPQQSQKQTINNSDNISSDQGPIIMDPSEKRGTTTLIDEEETDGSFVIIETDGEVIKYGDKDLDEVSEFLIRESAEDERPERNTNDDSPASKVGGNVYEDFSKADSLHHDEKIQTSIIGKTSGIPMHEDKENKMDIFSKEGGIEDMRIFKGVEKIDQDSNALLHEQLAFTSEPDEDAKILDNGEKSQLNLQTDEIGKYDSLIIDNTIEGTKIQSKGVKIESSRENQDAINELQIQNVKSDLNEQYMSFDSHEVQKLDTFVKSTDKVVQEEMSPKVLMDERQTNKRTDTHLDDDKTDEENDEKEEEDDHKIMESIHDSTIPVEARDAVLKPAHKKSHNILSGVGSKVKRLSNVEELLA